MSEASWNRLPFLQRFAYLSGFDKTTGLLAFTYQQYLFAACVSRLEVQNGRHHWLGINRTLI